MPSITLTIGELAPSLNGDKGLIRMHWSDYTSLRDRWIWRVRAEGVPSEVCPAQVEIARFYARQPLDLDNLYAASKVPLDALCETGWLRDDDPSALTALRCTQHKVSSVAEQRTVITITED